MEIKETIITPLKSAKKAINITTILFVWLLIASIVGIFTNGNIFILLPTTILSLIATFFCLIKRNNIKKGVYLFKKDKLYYKNKIIKLKEVTHKIDKHNNLILLKNNKKILKINRLSYNFEILLNYFQK